MGALKSAPLLSAGRPWPLGASVDALGVNFAVFSAHATAMELCLYSDDGSTEMARLPLPARSGDVWHGHVRGAAAGLVYGLRAHGPWLPQHGHRFNPRKLLLDPYARETVGALEWSQALLDPDADNGATALKARVVHDRFDWQGDAPPATPWEDSVIYELHVRGFSKRHPGVPEAHRGTYAGLASDAALSHLQRLGITAVSLLPVHHFIDEERLARMGLRNHWGYNSLGFFCPEPRYANESSDGRAVRDEFRQMVRRLHAAGIEVILDVVYNHTGEGDAWGPTLGFRGLDNRSYYRLLQGGRYYANDAGTGNTLDLTQPVVLRMVMDSLRYWVEQVHIDGFRFDLATVLGREAYGFDRNGGFFDAIRQDPVLARVKLIAEPWDIGPGGYQLGGFPAPFSEWNDKFRDGVRRFWRQDAGMAPEFSRRIMGSADKFDHDRRAATASVNFITSHDGFTLDDLVTYTVKRNLANGEDNRDGHDDNHADNMGVEGPSDDPVIRAARALRKRNLLATLLLSQGTPMLLAGDELGHSQAGNNNAYAQDNEVTRIDWAKVDTGLADFVARLVALRRAHPVLRQKQFLHSRPRAADGLPDAIWRRADGAVPSPNDWHDSAFRCIGVELRMAAEGPDAADALFVVFNGGGPTLLGLPDTAPEWRLILDTTRPALSFEAHRTQLEIAGQSVLVFEPIPSGDQP